MNKRKWRSLQGMICLVLFVSISSCGIVTGISALNDSEEDSVQKQDFELQGQQVQVQYTLSKEDILNPGRGFYYPFQTTTGDFKPLDLNELVRLRNTFTQPSDGNYEIKHNLFLRQYILDTYVTSDTLSPEFLAQMQADFDIVRQAGAKLIVRFSYTNTPPTGDCGAWICAPYGDASKEIVLAHIQQAGEVIARNHDVLLTWQAGFIGTWGEMMFTDHFGDFDTQGVIFDENWQDRIDMVTAILDAVPDTITVQVRKPQLIQKFVHGVNAPVTVTALTASQAHNGSNAARLGLYNDCFLATKDDWGTYADYGTSSAKPVNNDTVLNALKEHQFQNSQYTLVGGETCDDGYVPQNDCSGGVVDTIDRHNFTYLNSAYNNKVNNDWQDEGCMDEIIRRLGYRIHLVEGHFTATTKAGGIMPIKLSFKNTGFTSPSFPMALRLVFTEQTTGESHFATLDSRQHDIRHWYPEKTIEVNEDIQLPSSMPAGQYALSLHIGDMSNHGVLMSRPEYNIQLANLGTWDSTTGVNNLLHTITIAE